ncbi:E3 ubiquitin-protein ligase rnf5 [Rhizina undulata]
MSANDCPICLTPLTTPLRLNCTHIFCTPCLHSWLRERLPIHDQESLTHHVNLFFSRFTTANPLFSEVLVYSESLPEERRNVFQRRYVALYFDDVRRDMGLPREYKRRADVEGLTRRVGEGDMGFDAGALLSEGERRGGGRGLSCPLCRGTVRSVCAEGEREVSIQSSGILEALRTPAEEEQLWNWFVISVWQRLPGQLA